MDEGGGAGASDTPRAVNAQGPNGAQEVRAENGPLVFFTRGGARVNVYSCLYIRVHPLCLWGK